MTDLAPFRARPSTPTLQDLAELLSVRLQSRAFQRRVVFRERWVNWPLSTPVPLWWDCTSAVDLLVIPGVGRKSVQEVNEALHELGFGPLPKTRSWIASQAKEFYS